MKHGKLITSWNQEIDEEVKYRLEQQEEDIKDQAELKMEKLKADKSITINDPVTAWNKILSETREEKLKAEDQIRDEIWADSDYWSMLWDDEMNYLSGILAEKSPSGCWKGSMKNFGWRSQDGQGFFQVKNAQELIEKVLPHTDCHFFVYEYGKGIAINNFHHDSPTGAEWYYLLPISEEKYQENC